MALFRLITDCQNVTAHLLAGKDSETAKLKSANERGAAVVNLARLSKLLVGELTFKTLAALPALTRDQLKGEAYEMAVSARGDRSGDEQASAA